MSTDTATVRTGFCCGHECDPDKPCPTCGGTLLSPPAPKPPTPGRRLFEAYRAHAGGKNHDGSPTPEWPQLTEAVRAHWEAASQAVEAPPPPILGTGEVRTKDPDTGAEKGTKLARFDLIPAEPLWELALHYGKGAQKYECRNWERGYSWSLSFAACCRHLWAFWRGEDFDTDPGPTQGMPHLIAVAWHAFTIREFMLRHPEKDDRPYHLGKP